MPAYKYEIGERSMQTYKGLVFEAGSFVTPELILMYRANPSFSGMIYRFIEPWAFLSKMSAFQSTSGKFSSCAVLIMGIFV